MEFMVMEFGYTGVTRAAPGLRTHELVNHGKIAKILIL